MDAVGVIAGTAVVRRWLGNPDAALVAGCSPASESNVNARRPEFRPL